MKGKLHSLVRIPLWCLVGVLVVLPSMAKDTAIFDQYKIDLPFNVNHPVILADVLPAAGIELLIAGMDDEQQRILGIYGFDQGTNTLIKHDHISVHSGVMAFDVGQANAQGRQLVYLLSKNSVDVYVPALAPNASSVKPEQLVSSMYITDMADSFTHKDFAKDINDDGHDDLVLPHFEQLNLWLSNSCGERHYQSLPIAARLEVDNSSVTYDDVQLYFQDMNQDSKTDIVTVSQGALNVFKQNANKQFIPEPHVITLDPSIYGLKWWEIKGPTGQELDQSNLQHRKVVEIQDVNADNIPDLGVEFNQSSGVLDKIIDYEFFYGKVIEGSLTYSKQASTTVGMEQTLSGLSLVDINQDKQLEVVVSEFDIGVSQIIGALLSGSIDQNLMIFSMDENAQFNKKPLVEQDVEITFSLSSGSRGEPLTRIVDINGDGIKDIVFSDGDDRIRALLATPDGKKPYAKRSLRQKVVMPRNASKVASEDIDADGKTDFVLHYNRADSPELQKQVVLLMAR